MAKNISAIRGEVEDRIKAVREQLEPLSTEHGHLVFLRDCLDLTTEFANQQQRRSREAIAQERASAGKPRVRKPRAQRSKSTTKTAPKAKSSSKPGRKKGSGNRRGEVLKILGKRKKGLSVAQLGVELDIKPNYLHRIVNGLVAEKLVERSGKSVKVVG